jgi:hypothetical protein
MLQDQIGPFPDWRILKKMLSAPDLFASPENHTWMERIFQAVQLSIEQALELIFWNERGETDRWAKELLLSLKNLLREQPPLLKEALLNGRLDKRDSRFKHTLIFGDHGGVFALLNSLDPEES